MAVAEGRLEPDPVFGGQVYVEEAGDPSKETVVLVHGLGGGASNDWQGVAQRLQSHYHVLTFDLPGFGRSSTGEGDYTPTRYARLLRLLHLEDTGPLGLTVPQTEMHVRPIPDLHYLVSETGDVEVCQEPPWTGDCARSRAWLDDVVTVGDDLFTGEQYTMQ